MNHINSDKLPTGINVIVAIASYGGYNQEDSIIMNKSSIQRGLFSSMKYKTFKDNERQNQASLELETFCKPVKYNPNGTLKTAGTKAASYNLLNEDDEIIYNWYFNLSNKIKFPVNRVTEKFKKFKVN